jgi:Domain of unknown function (DUF1874).
MGRLFLANAFALSMLSADTATIAVQVVPIDLVRELLASREFINAVGHQSTAELLSQLLDMPIEMNRIEIKLERGDELIVFQLMVRPPEGKVYTKEELLTIPFKFYLVRVL